VRQARQTGSANGGLINGRCPRVWRRRQPWARGCVAGSGSGGGAEQSAATISAKAGHGDRAKAEADAKGPWWRSSCAHRAAWSHKSSLEAGRPLTAGKLIDSASAKIKPQLTVATCHSLQSQ